MLQFCFSHKKRIDVRYFKKLLSQKAKVLYEKKWFLAVCTSPVLMNLINTSSDKVFLNSLYGNAVLAIASIRSGTSAAYINSLRRLNILRNKSLCCFCGILNSD